MKKQPIRDPRTEPKVGDVLRKTIRKSLPPAVREVIAIHGDIVEFRNHKGKKLSAWLAKWQEWSAWAEVIKTAPCLILAALLLTGCDRWNSEIQDELIGMRVVQRDGCEYLANRNGHGSYVFTHKGDCTNHYSQMIVKNVNPQAEILDPPKTPAWGFTIATKSNLVFYSFDTNGFIILKQP